MAQNSPLFDTATTLGKVVAFFGVAALCGALAAGLALPAGMMAGAAADTGTEMLEELPAELREEPLSVPSRILASDGETELATFYAENRVPVGLNEISQHMQNAVIAIEDERFYEHGGVDAQGLARAMVNNLTTDSRQGASTITQQYVNNVLVNYQNLNGLRTTVSGRKTEADKLREMKLAVSLEKEMSKDEILEGYLNIVLFSGRVYGVEAAARYFFSKPASELNIPESAMLAGMVQSPNALNPENNPEAAKARRDTVINSMHRVGFISAQERDEAIASEIELNITPNSAGCVSAKYHSGYFCDYVTRKILESPSFGPDPDARQRLLDRGGLEIVTTLDVDLQAKAGEMANTHVPRDESEGIGSSLVTVEQNTGNIRAMANNTRYAVGEETNRRGIEQVNFAVDYEDGRSNGFQAGSALKPFVTLAWLGSGRSMTDTVDARRENYDGAEFPAYCLPGGVARVGDPARGEDGWEVRNAIANMKKPMAMNYGLYWSINTATVAAAYETDMCAITDLMSAAGVNHALTGESISPANPSIVLGAEEVSPLTMASAYSTFGSYGTYCEPRAFESVVDSAGNEYDVPPVNCHENALNEEHIKEMNTTLKGIGGDRTAQGQLNFDVAGKTGTNNTQTSGWFVGYTEGLSTAAWVGRYQNMTESLEGETIRGRQMTNAWGSTIAGPMWVEYMQFAGPRYPHGAIEDTDTGNPRTGAGRTGSANDSRSANED